ncbi:SAM-dependent methyltransferase [Pacificimonas sp. WHA3]|uniref:SAM-dependent methyltransferase n=1 Tax=Pacificimonas pallii TaxID=2827236 RepID=A0ABS6SAF3_9SPHN|nr:transcription antitermination factor NusB [Pacificimonas pallii]MBV7255354.1 SAM-dependent methyltransferase [Pacificimonas pallii]
MTDLPAGLPSRRAALTLLQAVLWRHQALEAALPRALRKIENPADRGLSRSIASLALRWLPDLDDLIDSATDRNLPEEAPARMVLRIALVQAIVMKTPHHAVVATALPLVDGGPRRLVHAVLARLLKEGAELPEQPTMPDPWATRWFASWGEEVVDAAGLSLAAPPPLDLTFKGQVDLSVFEDMAISLLPGHLRLPSGGRIEDLPGFEAGDWWVQDIAASLPARLLQPAAGERILDMAAAPGGKTMQLSAAGADVTALDDSEIRLERLQENLTRTGLTATLVEADGRKFTADTPYDAVLLDAPCSGTGIFRRHPDVLHLRKPTRMKETIALQAALLDHAATLVRPGGRLVYSVCSLERQEGEMQLAAFLERAPGWQMEVPATGILPAGLTPRPDGSIRTLPGDLADQGGLDGFYMARLRAPQAV